MFAPPTPDIAATSTHTSQYSTDTHYRQQPTIMMLLEGQYPVPVVEDMSPGYAWHGVSLLRPAGG